MGCTTVRILGKISKASTQKVIYIWIKWKNTYWGLINTYKLFFVFWKILNTNLGISKKSFNLQLFYFYFKYFKKYSNYSKDNKKILVGINKTKIRILLIKK